MSRIYTRTGDGGTTRLIGGKRVSKDSPYIEAGGSLDELNAAIGVVRSHALPERVDKVLRLAQESLFTIGAELASPREANPKNQRLGNDEILNLEKEIDEFEESLTPLNQFILPGGTAAGAQLHLVCAVARRTERRCVSVSRIERLNPNILVYLNRLSDLCFVLARYVNRQQSVPEAHPTFGKTLE